MVLAEMFLCCQFAIYSDGCIVGL